MCEQKAITEHIPDTLAPVEQIEGISILNLYPVMNWKDETTYQTIYRKLWSPVERWNISRFHP